MSNKPILPNAYVDIDNQNLGLIPGAATGIFAFTGVAYGGSAAADAIVSVGNNNEVRSLIGYGELADKLIDFFNNGGKKAYAIPLDETTAAVLGAVSKTAIGASTGTITILAEAAQKVPNGFSLKLEITKTGAAGVAKFKFSTDGGENYSPEIIVPTGLTYVIPTTFIEVTFVPGAGPVIFEDGDYHTSTITKPEASVADLETAVDLFIASDYTFDAIVAVKEDDDGSIGASISTKVNNAEAKPDFRYCYGVIMAKLSTSAAQAVTQAIAIRAAVGNDRIQVVTGEAVMNRPNHGDQANLNTIGAIVGRRSSLALQNDLGLFSAGALSNIISLRTGWTDTTLEDLDSIQTVTIRKFKGVAGYRPTNGHMTDPFSDIKKDAWRLVLDKASRIARLTGLGFLKIEVDPSDISGSTAALRNAIQNNLDTQIVGNGEAVSFDVSIPDGQNILVTEEIKVNIDAVVYGHASFIGITIGLVNPFTSTEAA